MCWKEDLVHDFFRPHDVQQILAMRLPSRPCEDFIAWQFEKNGCYSVRSAYRMQMEMENQMSGRGQTSTMINQSSPVWKVFWKIPIPHKVLNFGWKVAQNGLATQDNKKRRKLEVLSTCTICGMMEENAMHALVWCGHAQTLREAMRDEWDLPNEEFFRRLNPENLISMVTELDIDAGARVLLLLWRTWQVRNNITHASDKLSFAGSVSFLKKYWLELCSIRQGGEQPDRHGKSCLTNSLVAGRSGGAPRRGTNWEPPEIGWHKINVDGAFDCETGNGGVGVIIRDHQGRTLLTAWKFIPAAADAEEMEALACWEGIKLAAEWTRNKAVLETDCSSLVSLLGRDTAHRSRLKFVLDETVEVGRDLPEWTVVHTRRERNRVAHELAQLARRTTHCAVWSFNAPICVEHIIAQECTPIPE
ncbi:unnamed protein product [Urochloa humidicola]